MGDLPSSLVPPRLANSRRISLGPPKWRPKAWSTYRASVRAAESRVVDCETRIAAVSIRELDFNEALKHRRHALDGVGALRANDGCCNSIRG